MMQCRQCCSAARSYRENNMVNREKLLAYFRAGGDEDVAAKLLSLAEGAHKNGKYKVSDFLSPHEYNIAEIIKANFENITLEAEGGFANAERVKVAFVDESFMGQAAFGITYFLVGWDKRYYHLTHRDLLGAFIGAGCKREALGDIVFVPEGAQMAVDKNIAEFLSLNYTKVGNAPVALTELTKEQLLQKEEQVKVISATVADLRLDAVAAAGYGVSRSHMAEEIKSLNVKVNWKEAKKPAQAVTVGDVISFRGRGRVEVAEIRGTTKKGRIGLVLKRFI